MDGNSPKYSLVTYSPLVETPQGQEAIKKYNYPPFVDFSCRREPDFESQYPSISCLCRRKMFAPFLHVGDKIIYITHLGNYLKSKEEHWRLVAILQVLKRFESHQEAAQWYRSQGIKLPCNCMVDGNEPLELDHTGGMKPCKDGCTEGEIDGVREWDESYKKRAAECGVFLACDVIYRELNNPPIITHQDFQAIFQKIPGTQRGKGLSEEQFLKLSEKVKKTAE